jgi:hypothetical protein
MANKKLPIQNHNTKQKTLKPLNHQTQKDKKVKTNTLSKSTNPTTTCLNKKINIKPHYYPEKKSPQKYTYTKNDNPNLTPKRQKPTNNYKHLTKRKQTPQYKPHKKPTKNITQKIKVPYPNPTIKTPTPKQKKNKKKKCPKTYQIEHRIETYKIKNKQKKNTQEHHNQILSKPCDTKKTPIRPTTKTHTKNTPKYQKRNHTKHYYFKTNTNKYEHKKKTFFPYLQSAHSQYLKNIKLYLLVVCKHHMVKNNLKDKNAYIDAPTVNTGITNKKLTIKKCKKMPNYTFFNKLTILKCGDIESNPGPRFSLLLNHPQEHHDKQKTYFYNKTTQLKPEYNHILELFKPYLICTQITTTNQHLAQFCINNNTCPESYQFYAILITLAPTPTQTTN